MSWLARIQNDLVIQTGDSREWRPQWMNATMTKEYNIAEFEFQNIAGTLVNRGQPKGRKYSLQIFFQGDDNLDVATDFETAADDPRPWTLTHPIYGRLTVQPTSLSKDNTRYNISSFTIEVIETITEDYPSAEIVPQDQVLAEVEEVNETTAILTAATITALGVSALAVNNMDALLLATQAETEQIIAQQDNTQDYYDTLRRARASLATIGSKPQDALANSQQAISAAASFTVAVQDRLNVFAEMMESATGQLRGVVNLSQKVLFQANGAAILTAMCTAAATPLQRIGRNPSTGKEIRRGDYGTRNDVLAAIERTLEVYDSYITTLDDQQSTTGGNPTSFIPDEIIQQQLAGLLNYTVSSLFAIAVGARQERSCILEQDSNWVLLAHRLYGLDPDDSTIEELMQQNSAGLSEMLLVRKNRKIVYYT